MRAACQRDIGLDWPDVRLLAERAGGRGVYFLSACIRAYALAIRRSSSLSSLKLA